LPVSSPIVGFAPYAPDICKGTPGAIRDLFRSGHRNALAVPGIVPIRKFRRQLPTLTFASIHPKPQK
jgi:hypothetical protein